VYKRIKFFDYEIFCDSLYSIEAKRKIVINTINPHSFMVAEEDKIFKNALKQSDILLPDGIGITLAIHMLNQEKIKKIAGWDIHEYLIEFAQKHSLSCYYMGSKESTLLKIKEKIELLYPLIKVNFYSPPFKNDFLPEENKLIIENINKFCPDILFVGMTAPKQEKWVYQNKNEINAKIIVSIGAVFDFFAETIKRPGRFWISIGMEGMIRVLKEPKRMWKRFVFSDLRFMFKIILIRICNFFYKK